LLQVFEGTIIASHQAVRAKSHETTSRSTTPACFKPSPRRKLSPTARRQPSYCARRSCPTLLQPSHRQQPCYSTAKSHEATSKSTTQACLSSTVNLNCSLSKIYFRFLKGPSLPTRAVPNSSSSHVLMSSSQPRPPTASSVEPSPSTKAVPHSSSSPVLLFSKKLSDTVSTQCAPAASAECLLSSCDRHRQPKLVVFEKLLQVFEGTIIASHQAVRAKSYEATSKRTTTACLPLREAAPTARRHSSAALEDVRTNSTDRASAEQLRSTPSS
jgi:hypothetical protein